MRQKMEGQPGVVWGRWYVLVGLALVVVALGNCDGGCSCGKSDDVVDVPETAQMRLKAYAEQLPQKTDMAFFFVDMEGVRSSTSELTDRFKGSLPVDVYRQEVRRVIGLDLLDKESYKKAGVHPDGGLSVAYYRDAPVVMLYVEDREKFTQNSLGSLKKYYRIDAEPVVDKNNPSILTLKGGEVEFSYAFLPGGLTVFVGGELQNKKAQQSAVMLGEVLGTTSSSSLGNQPHFKAFEEQFAASWPASVYANTPQLLSAYKAFFPALKGYQKEIVDAFAEQILWTGGGWKLEGEEIQGRAFFGVKPETMALFKGMDKPDAKSPRFKLMVGNDAYLFLRTSLKAKHFWTEYQKLMPEKQRKYVRKVLSNVKETTTIDLEKDLIENATGHAGVAIYGVNPLMILARRATQRMTAVTFAAHVQVAKPGKVAALFDGLTKELLGALQRRELPGGVVAYGFNRQSSTAPPFTAYLYNDVLTLASNGLAEEQILKFLTGEASKRADKVSSKAAKTLFESDAANGLYIHVPKVRKKVGGLGGKLVNNILGPQEELVTLLGLEDKGVSLEGTIRLKPVKEPKVAKPQGGQ